MGGSLPPPRGSRVPPGWGCSIRVTGREDEAAAGRSPGSASLAPLGPGHRLSLAMGSGVAPITTGRQVVPPSHPCRLAGRSSLAPASPFDSILVPRPTAPAPLPRGSVVGSRADSGAFPQHHLCPHEHPRTHSPPFPARCTDQLRPLSLEMPHARMRVPPPVPLCAQGCAALLPQLQLSTPLPKPPLPESPLVSSSPVPRAGVSASSP